MSSSMDPTGYIHLLCGTYSPTVRFAEEELAAIRARDPQSLVRCPECQVSTESRSYLPTYKTQAASARPAAHAEL
jgi:hypothetical protein